MWTIKDAENFINEHKEVFDRSGYRARIDGEVKKIGSSEYDLDIILTPISHKEFDFKVIMDYFPGEFTGNHQYYTHVTPDERIVSFETLD